MEHVHQMRVVQVTVELVGVLVVHSRLILIKVAEQARTRDGDSKFFKKRNEVFEESICVLFVEVREKTIGLGSHGRNHG